MSWVVAYRDQDGRRNNKGFVTREDAKAFLTLVEGESSAIHTPEHASITAAKAADLWLTTGELERLERGNSANIAITSACTSCRSSAA